MTFLHIIDFSQNIWSKKILNNINFLLNDNYKLTKKFKDSDICLVLFENTSEMKKNYILNYDNSFDNKKLDNNMYFYESLKNFFLKNKDKKFISYYRADQCNISPGFDYVINSCENHIFTIKDYLSEFKNNEDFLYKCLEILKNNNNLQNYFDKNTLIDTPKCKKDFLNREKYVNFPINFTYYPISICNNSIIKKIKFPNLINVSKKFDIFYCKHQRQTRDGIARLHVLKNIIPKLEKKYNLFYSEKLNIDDYYKYLAESKIVISPFGLGERVEDDDIGLYYNTIVIKPYPEYEVYDYFNTFTNKKWDNTSSYKFKPILKFCKSDFSNIEMIIDDILINYNTYINDLNIRKNNISDFIKDDILKKDFNRLLDSISIK